MRLQVSCEDRLGMTNEVLSILAKQNLDLRGIEIDESGCIYLRCPDIEFKAFSQLLSNLRHIKGVIDVKKIPYLPIETERNALLAVFDTHKDPLLLLDPNGRIQRKNSAFNQLVEQLYSSKISQSIEQFLVEILKPDVDLPHWLSSQLHVSHVSSSLNRLRPPFVLYRRILNEKYSITVSSIYWNDRDDVSEARVFMGGLFQFRQLTTVNIAQEIHSFDHAFDIFTAHSQKFRRFLSQAQKFALLDAPLLIVGETGTGKEMVAKACHQRSRRHQAPFLVVNCASMPDEAAETELFGCAGTENATGKKGQLEQADGGTVFLDEVGEMTPHLQTKLLRFLQDGTFRRVGKEREIRVDVKVICSTQCDLQALVMQGGFREDLYYRLNVLALTIPPLRERRKDIHPLTEQFLAQFSNELGEPIPTVSDSARHKLETYNWPGNVRQLRNVLYRARTQLDSDELTEEHLNLPSISLPLSLTEDDCEGTLEEMMQRYEANILTALYTSHPSSRKLAKRLGISHTAIANKLRQYGITKK